MTNPYRALAGEELDRLIQQKLFADTSNGQCPPYSTDEAASLVVVTKLRKMFHIPLVTGKTHSRPVRFFARWDSGPSTSTEVLAETLPLAVCRLALIVADKRH